MYNAGRLLMDLAQGKNFTTKDFVAGLASNIIQSYNPLGSDIDPQNLSGSIITLATPYIISPIVDVATNRDFTGRAIVPPNSSDPEQRKPDSQLYRKGVNPYFRDFAQFLNEATGGDDYYSGTLDWSPEQIQHIFNGYIGGIGSIMQRSLGMQKTWEEEGWDAIEPRQIPLYRRFSYKGDESSGKYEMWKELPYISSRYNKWHDMLYNQDKAKEAEKFKEENYGAIKFYQEFIKPVKAKEVNKIGVFANKIEKTGDEKTSKALRKQRDDIADKIGMAEVKAWDIIRNTKDKEKIDAAIKELNNTLNKINKEAFGKTE